MCDAEMIKNSVHAKACADVRKALQSPSQERDKVLCCSCGGRCCCVPFPLLCWVMRLCFMHCMDNACR